MRIREKTVADVVREASEKMSEANYSAVLVGGFVQTQPAAAHYISANAAELGGAEAVVGCIFHAALIAECFKRGNNRTVGAMGYAELDQVAGGDRDAALREQQPAILDYIEINVESPEMRRVLILLALAMEWVG